MSHAGEASSISQDVQKAKMRGFLLSHLAIAVSLLAIGLWGSSSGWVSSSDFHSCIEITGAILALAGGFACLVYFFGQSSRYFLIIGLGFFVAGSESLIHGILSWEQLFAGTGVDFSRFVPATYVAGRTVLALAIISAPFLASGLRKTANLKREALTYSLVGLALGGGATALAFYLPLPRLILPDRVISRPLDLVSAVLFLAAFIVILARLSRKGGTFSKMLLATILLNIGGQTYMSFSRQLYDTFFSLAHGAIFLGYVMPVVGISLEALQETKRARREIRLRKRAQERLGRARDELEARVRERTASLKRSNEEQKQEVTRRRRIEKILRKQTHESGERVKELRYLYSISEFVKRRDISLGEMLQGIVDLIPPGWQHPEITCAQLTLNDQTFSTDNFVETAWKQSADIVVNDQSVGRLSVCYLEEEREVDEGPFPKEERDLIDAIAKRIGEVVEHKQAEEELGRTIADLERFKRMAVGRELRMIELKREVNETAEKAGLGLPYDLDFAESATGDHENA